MSSVFVQGEVYARILAEDTWMYNMYIKAT